MQIPGYCLEISQDTFSTLNISQSHLMLYNLLSWNRMTNIASHFVLCHVLIAWSATVIFTIYGMLQTHKENAPECLTMTHYVDLKEKGLVLMRGEYNKDVLVSMPAIGVSLDFVTL
jgi:hypothetical protein